MTIHHMTHQCTLYGRYHFHVERFTTEMQRCVISNSDLIKEIAQEQCVCLACELSIKRYTSSGNFFAVFHLVLLCFFFFGKGAHWL